MKKLTLVLAALSMSTHAFADVRDEAPLDPIVPVANPVIEQEWTVFDNFLDDLNLLPPARSDLAKGIAAQTPVKSQGSRGTCSIFSTVGALESILKTKYAKDFDLNENYLEYLVMTKVKSYPSEGSDVYWNVPAIRDHGMIQETTWPYESTDWTKPADLIASELERSNVACNGLGDTKLEACQLSHLSPDVDPYAEEAKKFRADEHLETLSYTGVNEQRRIKSLLASGQPLLLGIEFFYGAWQHRRMVEYGIGQRDMVAWEAGTVSTPTPRDISLSRQHGAGHSVVVVGYDDAKKVYYFKNSWGQTGFGMKSFFLGQAEGAPNTAGFGTITYEYAHKFGSFNLVTLKSVQ